MWYVFGGIKTFLYHHFSYFNCNFDTSVSNFFESVLKGLPISGLLKYWGLAKQTGGKKRKSCSLLCVHTRSTCNIRVKKGLKPPKCGEVFSCRTVQLPGESCLKHMLLKTSCHQAQLLCNRKDPSSVNTCLQRLIFYTFIWEASKDKNMCVVKLKCKNVYIVSPRASLPITPHSQIP